MLLNQSLDTLPRKHKEAAPDAARCSQRHELTVRKETSLKTCHLCASVHARTCAHTHASYFIFLFNWN